MPTCHVEIIMIYLLHHSHHVQDKCRALQGDDEEIYFIISGTGLMVVDGVPQKQI